METRPALDATLTGAELRRWYWTLAELAALARELGVPVGGGGGKAALAQRLAAVLDGAPVPPAPPRAPRGQQLAGPLHGGTVLPPGQRCSEALRAWFAGEIGPAFRFDAPMREFVAGGAGRTLDEGVAHWHATRGAAPREIAPQFELNRFLRARRATHPGEPREAALAAWRTRRARPRDEEE